MTDQHPGPEGWYPDPERRYYLRYWDGGTWTEQRAPSEPRWIKTADSWVQWSRSWWRWEDVQWSADWSRDQVFIPLALADVWKALGWAIVHTLLAIVRAPVRLLVWLARKTHPVYAALAGAIGLIQCTGFVVGAAPPSTGIFGLVLTATAGLAVWREWFALLG